MEFKDYYAILGVPKTATEKEIKQAYRKLARKLHPDVNPGDKAAESRFKDINEAYEVLGDTSKRAKYDELGANWRHYEQAQQAYARGAEGAPGGSWTWTTAGGPGGFHTIDVENAGEFFGEGSPFSDFFQQFFGGAAAAGGEGPRRVRVSTRGRRRQGEDIEQGVHLTLDQAYRGDTVRVSIKHGGHARTVDVRIPAGVKDGARVRVAGEGDVGTGGAPSGDLYLHVQVLPHATFERKGQDLLAKLPVPVTTAVLGGQTSVTTIAGRTLRLRIPEGTQQGQVFRLRGHGMPIVGKPDQFGDLLASVEIVVPRTLSEEQRRHYEALATLEG
ncbi:MAG: J domain-containing protein [Vicinamibacterales bacterium]|nr:J domain-containing protein [Vicinamibacterales bacterium]